MAGPRDAEPRRGRAPGGRAGTTSPPFANRGVDTHEHLASICIDWLTVSLGLDDIAGLMEGSKRDADDKATTGFKASEKRQAPGGVVWRRTDPHQESKAWGYGYESWEAPGTAALWLASELRSIDSRPSRVDIAFDLADGRTADDLLESCRPHFTRKRLTDGISGQAGINTRYIGGQQSERRIRIYRKDLQSESWAVLHGSTLRVELVLKDRQAHAFWEVWQAGDEHTAYAVAAGHIQEMSGLELMADVREVPQLAPVEQSSAAERVAQFIRQNAGTFVAIRDAGINLNALADAQLSNASRMTQHRSGALHAEIQSGGHEQVQHLAELILRADRKRKRDPAVRIQSA